MTTLQDLSDIGTQMWNKPMKEWYQNVLLKPIVKYTFWGFLAGSTLTLTYCSGNSSNSMAHISSPASSQIEQQVKDFLKGNIEERVKLDFESSEPRLDLTQNPSKLYINLYDKTTKELVSVIEIVPTQSQFNQINIYQKN